MIIGRRDFLIGAGAAAYPRFAHAQERSIPIVGVINSSSATLMAVNIAALRKAIADGGIQEGRDFVFEYRWAEGEYERLPHLMNELLERQCAVIVADGNVAARIAKAATSTVPIVFTTGDDPVSVGLVSNLNHPGGNLTGSTAFAGSLPTKRLELLHELVPTAKIIGILVNPTNANAEGDAKSVEAAARLLNLNVFVSRVSAESDFEPAFQSFSERGAGAIVINTDALFTARRNNLIQLADRYRIAAVYSHPEFPQDGGLMSYGALGGFADVYREAGSHVVRVLMGQKPGELPVVQPTKFAFVLNVKTAKALGLTIADKLLALADEVIE